MNKQKITIYTDGGSRGNPGTAGAGSVITDSKGINLKNLHKNLGKMTNNEAEYEAVLLGLNGFKKMVGKAKLHEYDIEVKLDSELVSKHLTGEYQIKEERLHPYFIKIWNMQVKDFPKIKFTYIPREKNKKADELANIAMDEGGKKSLF